MMGANIRAVFLLAAFAVISNLAPRTGRAEAPGSPEDVVSRAMDALNQGRLDTFVKAMHPDALDQFRSTVLDILDAAAKKGKESQLLAIFEGVAKAEDLKSLDDPRMFAALLAKQTSDPDAKKLLAGTRIDVVGRIAEGKEKAYVVYRSRMKFGNLNIDRVNAASLLKSGQDWKLSLLDDLAGQLATMKESLVGEPTLPDLSATKVEPLGHVLEGKKTAMVVYRSSMPIGASFLTKLSVLSVPANDPAFDGVRKGDKDVITGLIEKSLGIQKPPPPAVVAAQKAAAEQMMQAARLRADRLSQVAKDRTLRRASPESSRSTLPDGLAALPASFFGGDRDRFQDVAPPNGILVGVRVSYIVKLGGPKISSVQPVYRVGVALRDGKRYGTLSGKEIKAIAKPGYAVGAVNARGALWVDGFELVFKRVKENQLDADDSYKSPWLGDAKGSPREVESDGKIPVGLQGRAGREVNALGLIVRED